LFAAVGVNGTVGPYELRFGTGTPGGTYVDSVVQGDSRSRRDPFFVNVDSGPVQVLLKRDGARIRGKVTLGGNPPRPAYVVLAPKEREAKIYFRTAATDRDGVFQLQGIAPGEYDLFAFDREANYSGLPTVRAYEDRGVPVSVTAGQELTMNPSVVRIEK
jgi:hypothetical protein